MTHRKTLDRLIQAALAPGAATYLVARTRDLVHSIRPEDPVLDVGCGTVSPLAGAGIRPIGIDIDRTRVRAYGGPAIVADAAALPFATSWAAAAFSFGLLHHLTDAQARSAIAEMVRVVRPDGSIAIFDGVLPGAAWRRPLAAMIRAADRGRHMRREAALIALFDGAAGWHYERVTYAATGLEGVWCVRSA